jgi:hypothetical protein
LNDIFPSKCEGIISVSKLEVNKVYCSGDPIPGNPKLAKTFFIYSFAGP